jgi:nucleoside-diphosphate-sugar epimerase
MELTGKTIAVTGASGMLGAYICRALLEAGANVRGVVRNPEKAAFLTAEGVVFAQADLADRAALAAAFRGADAVISNAALYSIRNMKWADNYKANKEGTENVYEAAAAAGVRRVVQISTFGVYRWRLGARLTEDHPQLDGERKQGGAYRATKQLSERIAWELSQRHGIALTVLRPTGIYGTRDENLIAPLRGLMKSPLVPMPTAVFPLVFAGDVANAVVGALRNDASQGKAYNTGGEDGSLADFLRAWKRVTGAKNVILPLPVPVRLLIDNGRAQADLGFTNRPFDDGLREVFAAEKP